jgi:hypothetical protein
MGSPCLFIYISVTMDLGTWQSSVGVHDYSSIQNGVLKLTIPIITSRPYQVNLNNLVMPQPELVLTKKTIHTY